MSTNMRFAFQEETAEEISLVTVSVDRSEAESVSNESKNEAEPPAEGAFEVTQ